MTNKQDIPRENTKKKIRHHIPKIMLDLYENRKSFDNFSRADVVRSLIPKMSGKWFVELISSDTLAKISYPHKQLVFKTYNIRVLISFKALKE